MDYVIKPPGFPVGDWARLTLEEKKKVCGMPPNAPAPAGASGSTEGEAAPASLDALTDLRDWPPSESIDDIPGERIRNCIIYQLDVAKSLWYRSKLSIGFLKFVFKDGRTGARRLHEDTPPGWTPNPLLRTVVVPLEGGEKGEMQVPRKAKNADEWRILHGKLFSPRNVAVPAIRRLLAQKSCLKCGGRGGYNKKSYPNAKSIKRRFEEFYCSPCECCHHNPFDESRMVRCQCGRDILVPKAYDKEKLSCKDCGALYDNPHLTVAA